MCKAQEPTKMLEILVKSLLQGVYSLVREVAHLPVALRGRMTQTVSGGRTMKLNFILKFICMVIWSLPLSQMTFVAQISQFYQPVPTTKK